MHLPRLAIAPIKIRVAPAVLVRARVRPRPMTDAYRHAISPAATNVDILTRLRVGLNEDDGPTNIARGRGGRRPEAVHHDLIVVRRLIHPTVGDEWRRELRR